MKKLSNRIAWSPLYGGCMMEQRMVNGAWVDNNSMSEGEFPVYDARAKLCVKWHNYRLREERYKERAAKAQEKYLRALCKATAVRTVMDELGKEIRKLDLEYISKKKG